MLFTKVAFIINLYQYNLKYIFYFESSILYIFGLYFFLSPQTVYVVLPTDFTVTVLMADSSPICCQTQSGAVPLWDHSAALHLYWPSSVGKALYRNRVNVSGRTRSTRTSPQLLRSLNVGPGVTVPSRSTEVTFTAGPAPSLSVHCQVIDKGPTVLLTTQVKWMVSPSIISEELLDNDTVMLLPTRHRQELK